MNSHYSLDYTAFRMMGTRVYVTSGLAEDLCGTVDYDMHAVPEDVVECGDREGDGVMIRGGTQANACIHVFEIKVFQRVFFTYGEWRKKTKSSSFIMHHSIIA